MAVDPYRLAVNLFAFAFGFAVGVLSGSMFLAGGTWSLPGGVLLAVSIAATYAIEWKVRRTKKAGERREEIRMFDPQR